MRCGLPQFVARRMQVRINPIIRHLDIEVRMLSLANWKAALPYPPVVARMPLEARWLCHSAKQITNGAHTNRIFIALRSNTTLAPRIGRGPKRPRGGRRPKLSIDEEREVALAPPARGSRFKGYTRVVVRDLVFCRYVVDFRCERWRSADSHTITAPLPDGNGHFGPQLRRFVLAVYHQPQVTGCCAGSASSSPSDRSCVC
jgi:hypothetical protein